MARRKEIEQIRCLADNLKASFRSTNLGDPSCLMKFSYPAFDVPAEMDHGIHYMGRQQFPEIMARVLETKINRLVFLCGPYGCGKTTFCAALFASLWMVGREKGKGVVEEMGRRKADARITDGASTSTVEDVRKMAEDGGKAEKGKATVEEEEDVVPEMAEGDGKAEKGKAIVENVDKEEDVVPEMAEGDGKAEKKHACFLSYKAYIQAPAHVMFSCLTLSFIDDKEKLQELESLAPVLTLEKLELWLSGLYDTIIFIIDDGIRFDATRSAEEAFLIRILRFHVGIIAAGLDIHKAGIRSLLLNPALSDTEYTQLKKHFNLDIDIDEDVTGRNLGLIMEARKKDSGKLGELKNVLKKFVSELDDDGMLQLSTVLVNGKAKVNTVPIGAKTGCFYNWGGHSHSICKYLQEVAFTYYIQQCKEAAEDVVLDRMEPWLASMEPSNVASVGWLAEKASLLCMSRFLFQIPDGTSPWQFEAEQVITFPGTFHASMLRQGGCFILYVPIKTSHEAVDAVGETKGKVLGFQISAGADPQGSHKETLNRFLSWFEGQSYELYLIWIGSFGVNAPSSQNYGPYKQAALNFSQLHSRLHWIEKVCLKSHGKAAKSPFLSVQSPSAPAIPTCAAVPAIPSALALPSDAPGSSSVPSAAIPTVPSAQPTLALPSGAPGSSSVPSAAIPTVPSAQPTLALPSGAPGSSSATASTTACAHIFKKGLHKGHQCGKQNCKVHKKG